MHHFNRKKELDAGAVVIPPDRCNSERHFPKPNAVPLGTFGRNRSLVYRLHDTSEAVSATEWGRRGYRVKSGEEPLAVVTHSVRGVRNVTYGIYGSWQVERKHPKRLIPEERDYGDGAVLRALWTLNRQAKRYRNRAQSHYRERNFNASTGAKEAKENVYCTKSMALSVLHRLGEVQLIGVTDGRPSFAVFAGAGYVFHCPRGLWQSEAVLPFRGCVEARPRTSAEMRLRDAWATVRAYLSRHAPTEDDERATNAAVPPAFQRTVRDDCDDDEKDDDDSDEWGGAA